MDALLERLEPLYYALVVLVLLLPRPRLRALAGAGLALVALSRAAAAAGAAPAPDAGFVTINEIIALVGIVLVLIATGLSVRRSARFTEEWPREPPPPALPPSDPFLLAGLLLGALSPQVVPFGIGSLLVLLAALRSAIRPLHRFGLAVALTAALLLGAGLTLLLIILGPEQPALSRLGEAPISEAAERLLTFLFGGAALALAGIPPLGRVPWGRRLIPFSALVVGRLVIPDFPLGVASWQAAAMLWLALGLAWVALAGRSRSAVALGGLFVVWSGTDGLVPGAVLIAWTWLADIPAVDRLVIGNGGRWRGLPWLPVALAALPALRAGLAAQVVLSVGVVAAGAGSLLRFAMRPSLEQARYN